MTIQLLWWHLPVGMWVLALLLSYIWPNVPGGSWTSEYWGAGKMLVIWPLILLGLGIFIGRLLV